MYLFKQNFFLKKCLKKINYFLQSGEWGNSVKILIFFLNFPYIVLKTKFLVKNKTSTNLCRRLRRRKFYSNIVLILHNYCMNIVQILYKYRSNIVQLLSKYCTTIVQTLYIMLCEYCTKYCLNNVKISYIN